MVKPATHVTPDGRVVESDKDPELDRDRFIPLSENVARNFAHAMTEKLASKSVLSLLDSAKAALLARVISNDAQFPFTAHQNDGRVELEPALEKMPGATLKDISDGVTRINKNFVVCTQAGEGLKFALATLFQKPVYDAYKEAGMTEGPHTKYVKRA